MFAFIALTAYFLILNTKPTFAQTPATPSANYQSPAYISPQSPNMATKAIYDFGHAMNCLLIGQSPIAPCLEYKTIKNSQGVITSIPVLNSVNTSNGLLGVSLSVVGEIIATPPIKSSEFIADLEKQIGIKSANAQVGGSGSGVLSPIFKLWEVSRNISYLVMILIFVFVGLMVMFRQKLNPQTVVSIQLALPGLVIGLVMMTFSYFLAALISDLAFVGTNIVGYYFSLAQTTDRPPTQLPLINRDSGKEDNVLTIFSRYTGILNTWNIRPALDGVWPYLKDPNTAQIPLIKPILGLSSIHSLDPQDAISILANMLAVQFLMPFGNLWPGWGQVGAGAAPTVIEAFGGTTLLVSMSLAWVAMIAVIYSMFRLLLKLINNLLSIIFLTITAPFYFLAASIPGRQGLAATWAFNMLCNVLAFPAVFAVFYFIAYLLGGNNANCSGATNCESLFLITSTTKVAGATTFPLLGGLDVSFLNRLIAFGALLALPSIPDIICRAVGKPSQLGALAAGAIGGAISSGQKYQGQATSGISGFANTAGRLNDTKTYHIEGFKDGKPQYEISPYQSHAGLINRIKLNMGMLPVVGSESHFPGKTTKK